jgi:hypothetical protein
MRYEDITAQQVLANRRTQPGFEIPAGISVPDAEHIRQALRALGTGGQCRFLERPERPHT